MNKFLIVFLLMFSALMSAQQKIENKTVDAACSMCQFKTGKGCAMAVKIDGKVYNVEGVDKKSFGEMHGKTGYCKIIQKAVVSGEIRNGKFYATSFAYAN